MSDTHHQAVIEGLLFVSGDEGLDEKQIRDVLDIDIEEVRRHIDVLRQRFESEERGLQIVDWAGHYQLTTKPEHAEYFKRLVESPQSTTLSQAALETLAIIAYKQPIARVDVEDLRGVKSERPIRTLQAKGLIQEVGRSEGTGRAILYGTTSGFLDQFGLRSLDELPPLPDTEVDSSIENEVDLFFSQFEKVEQEHESTE
ncbi:SMC-Scp complex subunit ScpB [Texcoconibacillus texcoconensis]|uniref:Segregation and condensation protein B n=1 Tax=Texcoconibacillus texcoconensis TaxID=1095777 RepID=A0A840QNN7_9BACI|nr:SMC-Scp complex subunit ScpB [Texcoconibacillus texcoconensis]MBB5172968.1 segregation and condensation protein B [Texcoconibacillus texcoconensis]